MRKLFSFICGVALVGAAVSCASHDSSESNIPETKDTGLTYMERISLRDSYDLSQEQVQTIFRNFQNAVSPGLHPSTRNIRIGIGETSRLHVSLNTKMGKEINGQEEEIPIYRIDLKNEESCGYALISGDARNPSVIVYIPDTVSAEESSCREASRTMVDISKKSYIRKIEDFNARKESLRKSAQRKLEISGKTRSSIELESNFDDYDGVEYEKSETHYPLMRTQWGQGYPYSCKLAQECDSRMDGRVPAGCGVISIAQAIAHYEPALAISGSYVDWNLLKQNSEIPVNADKKLRNAVGVFIKWVYDRAGAKSNCKATSTGNVIGDVLEKANMKCDNTVSWNWSKIYQSLSQGRLVEAKTVGGTSNSHSWIVDGYIIKKETGMDDEYYVHNNFGWNGDNDGYYQVENPASFETYAGSVIPLKINANIQKK